MSEPENFLSRWSRRKLESEPEQDDAQRASEAGSPPAQADDAGAEQGEGTKDAKPGSSRRSTSPRLPSLESITSETDIRLFLQKGVPADLTRAALRRAWSADPAIRDFIEIAENQYDFATGSDLPGFGPLDASADEIRKMVANVFGDGPKVPVEQQAPTSAQDETPAIPESSEVAGPSAEPVATEDIAAAPQDQQPLEAAEVDLQMKLCSAIK